jgi:outer membrane protein
MKFRWPRRITLGALLCVATPLVYADTADTPWQVRAGISNIVPTSSPGNIAYGRIDIDSSIGPTFNLAYFITPHWAVDVLGGLPFKHDIRLNGDKVGSTRHLPPIVSLQYHFAPNSTFRPFVGIGVNYTHFCEEDLDGGAKLELSDSWGPAYQVGLDVAIAEHWTLGGDVRYAKINSEVKIAGSKVGNVDVDPTIYSLNIGYRF